MCAPADSWTLPSHLFLVSAWSAPYTDAQDPMSCSSNLGLGDQAKAQRGEQVALWAWTDTTWLLHRAGVSWVYYVGYDTCFIEPSPHATGQYTAAFQNALPGFTTVRQNHQLRNIQGQSNHSRRPSLGPCPPCRG